MIPTSSSFARPLELASRQTHFPSNSDKPADEGSMEPSWVSQNDPHQAQDLHEAIRMDDLDALNRILSESESRLTYQKTQPHGEYETQKKLTMDETVSWCRSNGLENIFSRLSQQELSRAMLQKVSGREQLMDTSGEFVLTDITKLPIGAASVGMKVGTQKAELYICGDIGYPSRQQDAVFDHLRQALRTSKNDALAMIVGDWLYPKGPLEGNPSEKAHFQRTVADPIAKIKDHTPVLGVLGNHEYGNETGPADPHLFMQWAKEAGVTMPTRYYKTTLQGPRWAIDMFCLDSTSFICDDKQLQWLKAQIKESNQRSLTDDKKRWKIVVAHHPLVSFGFHHGNLEFLKNYLGPELQGIDLYLSGHEHDQEMNHTQDLPPIVVSGTGSESRPKEHYGQSKFLDTSGGYCRVTASEKDLKLDFVAAKDIKPVLYREIIRA